MLRTCNTSNMCIYLHVGFDGYRFALSLARSLSLLMSVERWIRAARGPFCFICFCFLSCFTSCRDGHLKTKRAWLDIFKEEHSVAALSGNAVAAARRTQTNDEEILKCRK